MMENSCSSTTRDVWSCVRSCIPCKKLRKKCDRRLPNCERCGKRGITCSYNLTPGACLACAKAKVWCSREPQCHRCISKGLECYYAPLHENANGSTESTLLKIQGSNDITTNLKLQALNRKVEQLDSFTMKSTPSFLSVLGLAPTNHGDHAIIDHRLKHSSNQSEMLNVAKRTRKCPLPKPQLDLHHNHVPIQGLLHSSINASLCHAPFLGLPLQSPVLQVQADQKHTIEKHQSLEKDQSRASVTKIFDTQGSFSDITPKDDANFSTQCLPYDIDGMQPKSLSPSQNRLPPETSMIGSRSNLALACFIRKYSSQHYFLVDTMSIQKAMSRAFTDPRGVVSLYRVSIGEQTSDEIKKDQARHAGVIAAVGLGAIQLWLLDKEMHETYSNLIWQLLKHCATEPTEEVIFAHGLSAQYCLLINNMNGFLKHLQLFNQLVTGCAHHLQNGRILAIHSYFSLWNCLQENGLQRLESDKYTWQLIVTQANSFCCFQEQFPHMYSNAKKQAPSDLGPQQQQVLLNYLTFVPTQNISLLCVPSLSWVRKVLIDDNNSDDFKTEALQEVLNFIDVVAKFYRHKGSRCIPPIVKCFLLSIQAFLMLLAGKCSESKEILRQQVQIYCNDYFLSMFLLSSQMIHQAHFLCMALSTLEMHDSYQTFQKKMNKTASFLGLPHIPRNPPISNHGLCGDQECMLLWHQLSIPNIPKFDREVFKPELWNIGMKF